MSCYLQDEALSSHLTITVATTAGICLLVVFASMSVGGMVRVPTDSLKILLISQTINLLDVTTIL